MNPNNRTPRVTFEDDAVRSGSRSYQDPVPKMVRMLVQYSGGLIKDARQANYLLIGVVVVGIVASCIILNSMRSEPRPPERSITGAIIQK